MKKQKGTPALKDRLRHIRLTLGYSQMEFADLLNIEVNTYRGYEYKTKNLPNMLLVKLVDVFNVNLDYLFTGNYPVFRNSFSNTLKIKQNPDISDNISSFGKRYTKILLENNITDYEFSRIVGIPEHRLEKLGLGVIPPTLDDINRIKARVDVNIDWLLYGDYNKQKQKTSNLSNSTLNEEEVFILKKIIKQNKHLFE
ncbi:MAG: helix-turn-helix transcriptional regulator [Candidatus Gastranaerophilales bacterium]|nr:helix-turn-helix transcriptional regulator [Candidatus Gastranaerophilales bacterium]